MILLQDKFYKSVDLFDSNTGLSLVTNCMISVDHTDSGTPTVEATADGIKWDTVILNEVHTFTNTGIVLKIRFTGSGTGSINNWAYLYNPDSLETNYLTIPSARKQKDFYYEGILQDEDIIVNAWYPDNSITIDKITLNVRSAPVGGNITVDIMKNGVEQTLISTLVASSTYQVTSLTTTAFTAVDRLGLIIKSIGALGTEGEGLLVTIHYYD